MQFPKRPDSGHGILPVLEVIAVVVWILAAVLVLYLATGAYAVVRFVAETAGANEFALALGRDTVAVLAGLGLVSGGALAVIGYVHVFATKFERIRPLWFGVVPLVGIVAPVGYVLATTGEPSFPTWTFVIVAIAAHALAFRTIAVGSVLEGQERLGVLAGAVASVPAATAILTLSSGLSVVGDRPVVHTIQGGISWTGIPLYRPLLVVVPLVIATAYTLVLIRTEDGSDAPWAGVVDRFGGTVPSVGIGRLRDRSSGTEPSNRADSSSDDSSTVVRRVFDSSSAGDDRSARRQAVVPSSPSESGSTRRRPSSSSGGSSARKSDRSKSGSADSGGSSVRGAKTSGSASGSDSSARSNAGQSTTGRDESTSPARDEGTDGAADAESEGTGSDTRIFVDDFDPAEVDDGPGDCPDCGEAIPTDGSYTFCPFCGSEL